MVINEQEAIIHNLIRDLRAVEKELGESRKRMKIMEAMLEESNKSIQRLNSEKLNLKYCERGL
jgi:hypothetical protein